MNKHVYLILSELLLMTFSDGFLPHDAMHKHGLCRHAVSVCLCVCVSVTFMDCVKTNKHIFRIFSPSGSHTILVFLYQTGWQYSDGNPPNGGVECRWGREIAILSLYACCWCCNKRGVVHMVAGGQRPPSRKLWHLYRWSYTVTAPIRPPSPTRDKVTVSVVLQRESDQARSRTIIYTITIDRMYDRKAWRYAEDNRTESNCMH